MIRHALLMALFAAPALASHPHLVAVTPEIDAYAKSFVVPRLNACTNDVLARLEAVVDVLVDGKVGVGTLGLGPQDYGRLASAAKGQAVPAGSPLSFVAAEKREPMRLLFNKYSPMPGIFFGPTASDVVKYRMAFGCTHYARAFLAVAKCLELTKPEDLRYAISVKADEFEKLAKDPGKTMNGHQFVIARIGGEWIAINTSRKNDTVKLPASFDPEKPTVKAAFASYPGVTFLIRKVGRDWNDGCGDDSLERLMGMYRTGR